MNNKEIRKQNLRFLLGKFLIENPTKGKKDFAELCDTDPAVLSQVLRITTPDKEKNIGDKLARKIEIKLALGNGWLDKPNWLTPEDKNTLSPDQEEPIVSVTNNDSGLNKTIPVRGEVLPDETGTITAIDQLNGVLEFTSNDLTSYALRIKGDSLWPRINSGEFIVIEPLTVLHSGDEVFVRLQDGQSLIKKITYIRDDEYQFLSINTAQRPLTIQKNEIAQLHHISAIIKSQRYKE